MELKNAAACANIVDQKVAAEGLEPEQIRVIWRQDKNFVGMRLTDLRPLSAASAHARRRP